MADVREGDLVGWKFRAALVLGHVKAVAGDMLRISPVSRPSLVVSRRRAAQPQQRQPRRGAAHPSGRISRGTQVVLLLRV